MLFQTATLSPRPQAAQPEPAAEHAPETTKSEKIVTAARQLFVQNGYETTSVEEIVALAGVGKGTFYALYPSKAAALTAVIDHFLEIGFDRDDFASAFDYLSGLASVLTDHIGLLTVAQLASRVEKGDAALAATFALRRAALDERLVLALDEILGQAAPEVRDLRAAALRGAIEYACYFASLNDLPVRDAVTKLLQAVAANAKN